MPAGAGPALPAGGMRAVDADVLVVGAGPAGLAAAAELRRLGVRRVLVADREAAPGGIPRHSGHTGYGLRDLHRVLSGPAYARALTDAAARAGAELRPGCTVTGLRPGGDGVSAVLTSAAGIEEVRPAAVLLATGCRERPRAARLVPGDRPSGVLTTGELQQRVYLAGERLAGRALVVGAEHVSFSAAVTLAHAGARVLALVTDQPRHQSYAAFQLGAALRWRVPVWTSTAVTRVTGADGRLAAVDVVSASPAGGLPGPLPATGSSSPATGFRTTCSRGPRAWRSTRAPAARRSARAWRRRHRACSRRATWCTPRRPPTLPRCPAGTPHGRSPCTWPAPGHPEPSSVPVVAEPPLRWISPNAIDASAGIGTVLPPLGRFAIRPAEFRERTRLEAWQDGRLLARSRPLRLIPGRPVHLRAAWVTSVDPSGGPVRVGVAA